MDVHCFIYVFDARESYIAFLQLLLCLRNLRQVRGVSVPPVLCPIVTSIGCVQDPYLLMSLRTIASGEKEINCLDLTHQHVGNIPLHCNATHLPQYEYCVFFVILILRVRLGTDAFLFIPARNHEK